MKLTLVQSTDLIQISPVIHALVFVFVCVCIVVCSFITQVVSCNYFTIKMQNWGFPGGAVIKNPSASAGDTGSSPGPGRSHMPRSN